MKNSTITPASISGSWQEQKDRLKAKISILSGSDLLYEDAKKDEMLYKLQVKLGKTKEEIVKIISAL